ncbi:DUF3800 domain-containing protein [Brevundimonas vesicularis]|uniref:DUF3800 domain-containing protein n=1 Tax=Brevundimonas vesicularis TaxID=41276 RepID=A0A1Z3U773_BREVE|nr:DUF3800 domain-containing protein [Brevundimonas vesicularis]ASE39105.1 DUF3800 domain-containing protein [Brevundimonas vesicularis]
MQMSREYIVYIDEAGDEGFGKLKGNGQVGGQSHWLAIGACIVSAENDQRLPALKRQILGRFPNRSRRDLHFRDLNHDQKIVACQEIGGFPLGAAVMLSNKTTLPGSKFASTFKQKGYLYNYLVRWLLERVTLACEIAASNEPCRVRLVFSRRGGTDYHSMGEYLRLMRNGREFMPPVRSIRWNVLNVDDILVEDHSKWAGLQVADCITSAFWTAVEPNVYGNHEPAYAELLKSRLLQKDGNALNRGLTPVPSFTQARPTEAQRLIIASFMKGCG